jgi:hypothetical protein
MRLIIVLLRMTLLAFRHHVYLSGDKKERLRLWETAFQTVVLPLVEAAQKNPGWREFHRKDHRVTRKKTIGFQCPLLLVSATRLPNKTRPQSKSSTPCLDSDPLSITVDRVHLSGSTKLSPHCDPSTIHQSTKLVGGWIGLWITSGSLAVWSSTASEA